MICENCKYLFHAADCAVSLYDRKIIVENLWRFVPTVVCPRCGYWMQIIRWWNIRRYRDDAEYAKMRHAVEEFGKLITSSDGSCSSSPTGCPPRP